MPTSPPRSAAPGRHLPALLLLLTVFGPISMDLYLPALPALTRELGAATSTAQLTVTACLAGLALGQLVAGPLSDRYGRRRVLLVGVVAYVVTSLLCAAAPSVELLVAARLVQGLAGGVGIVIAQAAGRDVFNGRRLLHFYGQLTVTGGLAAVVGPLLGGALTSVTDWRGLFVFLSAIGVLLLLAAVLLFPETLPPGNRVVGGIGRTGRDYRLLLADRGYVGTVLSQGFVYAALFAYLAGATYVLQGIYGLTPQGYALAFGLNSAGYMVAGHLAGRCASRWGSHRVLLAGTAVAAVGAAGLLLAGLTSVPVGVVVVSLLVLAAGVAVTSPPATTLALAGYPQIAGTASSLLGMVRFGFGGIAAPLVGVAGAGSILPLGVVTVSALVLAATTYLTLSARPRADRASDPAVGARVHLDPVAR
jgi:MFS transporter, DHA1 family, multidrug resistance protein